MTLRVWLPRVSILRDCVAAACADPPCVPCADQSHRADPSCVAAACADSSSVVAACADSRARV